MGYETTWPVFLAILAAYICISLVIGGKKTYFEPHQADEPESEETK
jgi:hypothetical protein